MKERFRANRKRQMAATERGHLLYRLMYKELCETTA